MCHLGDAIPNEINVSKGKSIASRYLRNYIDLNMYFQCMDNLFKAKKIQISNFQIYIYIYPFFARFLKIKISMLFNLIS